MGPDFQKETILGIHLTCTRSTGGVNPRYDQCMCPCDCSPYMGDDVMQGGILCWSVLE